MEITAVYAIAAGGILSALFFIRTFHLLAPLRGVLSVFVSKHLTYPYFLNRHRFAGPWTRADVIVCIIYIATNLFCLFFSVSSTLEISRRAGELSLVNMVFLFTAPHLGLLADILGVSLRLCRNIHRFAAWMGIMLLTIHILVVTLIDRVGFSLGAINNVFAVIGSSSVALIMLLSVPIFRRAVYEWFIRTHQSLAGIFFYSTWRHLPSTRSLSGICIFVSIISLSLTSFLQAICFCYQNGFFTSRYPRAYIHCDIVEDEDEDAKKKKMEKAVGVRVVLSRAMKLDAGQYINLWMPTVSMFSRMQTHPFMVTSWSREEQTSLDLYMKVQGGLSATLYQKARDAPNGSVVFPTFVTGPHGLTEPVHQYERVLLVADGSGIAAVLPYLKKLIHGHNTMTCCTRRVHLVWQLHNLDMAIAAESSVNSLLKEDTLARGYILTTSIYVESGKLVRLGDHERAFLYSGQPNYRAIVQAEASGDFIKKTTNADEERGKLLVIVSLSDENRDQIRSSVRECLEERVTMVELEYQPS